MTKKRVIVGAVLVTLYAVTWVGGWVTHSHDLKAEAWQLYDAARRHDVEMARACSAEGLGAHPARVLLEGGPSAGVKWCVPVLPGILLADSYYVIAPTWGRGGVKVVGYYGFGSTVLVELWGWIS